jgi:hypothetical protein
MLRTTIAGSLPKPAWLAEPNKLWPAWRHSGADANDKTKVAPHLAALGWVPYAAKDRADIFDAAYKEFKAWAGQLRRDEEPAKLQSQQALKALEQTRTAVAKNKQETDAAKAELEKANQAKAAAAAANDAANVVFADRPEIHRLLHQPAIFLLRQHLQHALIVFRRDDDLGEDLVHRLRRHTVQWTVDAHDPAEGGL